MDRRIDTTGRQRRSWMAALTFVAFTLGFGCLGLTTALALGDRPQSSQMRRLLPVPDAHVLAQVAAKTKVVRARQMPRPVKIVIPAIGVSAPVIPLHLNRNRTLQVPKVWGQAGWFVGGPEPGEKGAAVIVGHVDSTKGPAVFYRLRALRPGDQMKVVLKNGTTVRFVVRSKRAVPKNRFPTELVFGKTTAPTLRLITCDGRFNYATHHYVDNLVVFASLA